jgi:hypothetical protein
LVITWNNPSNQPLRVNLAGTAVPLLSVEPVVVMFGPTTTTQTVRVYSSFSNADIRVISATSSSARFTTRMEEVLRDQEYLLHVTDTQPDAGPETAAQIVVQGSSSAFPTVRVAVRRMASLPPAQKGTSAVAPSPAPGVSNGSPEKAPHGAGGP